jgi:site-specific DNA-methyltransferase (adenine-specific)
MSDLGPYPLNAIITGDARELGADVPDASVDLIFTDPPYHRKYLPLYDWLAQFSARVLKPDGFVLTYIGNYWKDDVMALFRPHLQYFWDYILLMGNSSVIWQRRTVARGKSILAYRPKGGKGLPRNNVLGWFEGGERDKRYHDWGQDKATARYYIECFSSVGQIVLDPFVGGGTTAVVCERIRRPFLAFEIDPTTAELARQRLKGEDTHPFASLPLFQPQNYIQPSTTSS